MKRLTIVLLLLASHAVAQQSQWVSTQLGWFYQLRNNGALTFYGIGKNADGTFTLYQGHTALANGPDLGVLETQGLALGTTQQ